MRAACAAGVLLVVPMLVAAAGSPQFFVTQEAHAQLVSELPGVLAQVRKVIGPTRHVTVAFDRGG